MRDWEETCVNQTLRGKGGRDGSLKDREERASPTPVKPAQAPGVTATPGLLSKAWDCGP